MIDDCLKLTAYFGERDRAADAFLADALVDVYERHALQTAVVLRGIEGFGAKHHLQTDRLLTLSEDLPLVSVAVDTRTRIEAALPEVRAITAHGLITLERARMITGAAAPVELPEELQEATKLTVYCGRQERVAGRPVYVAVVDVLHRAGLSGAFALLGVDGTAHGVRRRARFFGRNPDVPLMIISIGSGELVGRVLPALGAMLPRPLMTVERVRLCKQRGRRLAEPLQAPAADPSGLPIWQKLTVYASEQARHGRHPLYRELIRRLRLEGASGATALRGFWGYEGGDAPRGDSFWALRRRVPVVTVLVDAPDRIRRWFETVDELTDEAGLVTSEMVPAFRAAGPETMSGTLALADLSSLRARPGGGHSPR